MQGSLFDFEDEQRPIALEKRPIELGKRPEIKTSTDRDYSAFNFARSFSADANTKELKIDEVKDVEPVYKSPSEINKDVKELLEESFKETAFIKGEIEVKNRKKGESAFSSKKAWYFTIRDEKAHIACVMFAPNTLHVAFEPKCGHSVLIEGQLTIFEKFGQFQCIVEKMSLYDEEGERARALKLLREKLEKEGLFNPARKRVIPEYPKLVCVIAGEKSDALADITSRYKSQGFFLSKIIAIPALVQGPNSPASLILALNKANALNPDLILISRGGGSASDLFYFNDEALARAVYASKAPVATAIGHQNDHCILDDVADIFYPLPAIAASSLFKSKEKLLQDFLHKESMMKAAVQNRCDLINAGINSLHERFKINSELRKADINARFKQSSNRLEDFKRRLNELFSNDLKKEQESFKRRVLELIDMRIEALPAKTRAIEQGYKLAFSKLEARLGQGEMALQRAKLTAQEMCSDKALLAKTQAFSESSQRYLSRMQDFCKSKESLLLQSQGFLEKSKHLVSLRLDGKVISPIELEKGMELELVGQSVRARVAILDVDFGAKNEEN